MDAKSKIFIVILALLFLGSTFLAYKYYSSYQGLFQEYTSDKESWDEEKSLLEKKVSSLKRELKATQEEAYSARQQLDELQQELDKWRKRLQQAEEEKQTLIDKLRELQARGMAQRPQPQVSAVPGEAQDTYWAQIVKQNAAFQAKLEELGKQLEELTRKKEEAESKLKEQQLENSTLKDKIEDLQRKLAFNERTIQILSQELVKEKEDKRSLSEDLDKFRQENLELKREVKRLEGLKEVIEKDLASTKEEKEKLSARIEEMENLIKEKTAYLLELRKKILKSAQLKAARTLEESKAVELPPIVVKPKEVRPAPLQKAVSLEGQIIAVNKENSFVIIDMGEEQGLKPGLNLSVYRNGSEIANLQVLETRKEISACDIVRVKPGVELRVGDKVK